ncbi:transcription factor TFIIH complex subunit Tfb5-domain-containing protein [Hypoxylon sp. FL1150]|nr:transcription factor TFIIH complex subunit Tfb5-domain-containing protein [Hypoxylon sp. FL1150]
MVRAVKGCSTSFHRPSSFKSLHVLSGTLVECDPSIKSIIINIDNETNEFIVEDLDETHLMIKDTMVAKLKTELEQACL